MKNEYWHHFIEHENFEMASGEDALDGKDIEIYMPYYEGDRRYAPLSKNRKQIKTGKNNLIHQLLNKKEINRAELAKKLGLTFAAVHKWYCAKYITFKTAKQIISNQDLELNWKFHPYFNIIFPHFNIIVGSPDNAFKWFHFFHQNQNNEIIGEKLKDDFFFFVVASIELFDRLSLVYLPSNPSEMSDVHQNFFITFIKYCEKIINEKGFIESYDIKQAQLYSLADLYKYPDNLNKTLTRDFDLQIIFEMLEQNQAYIKKFSGLDSIFTTSPFFDSDIRHLVKKNKLELDINLAPKEDTENGLSENEKKLLWKIESLNLKIGSLERKIDQLIYSLENNRNHRR